MLRIYVILISFTIIDRATLLVDRFIIYLFYLYDQIVYRISLINIPNFLMRNVSIGKKIVDEKICFVLQNREYVRCYPRTV